jgi:hypothetical protein
VNAKIIVVGDTHARWGILNSMLAEQKPDIVLQAGDFGYWPAMTYDDSVPAVCRYPDPGKAKLHWCEGNHEDYWRLAKREKDEVWPNVVYQPRGSTLTLPDGRVVLFMGGADSIDKESRLYGFTWFPDELITYGDIARLDPNLKVDIVVSHTCPAEIATLMVGPKMHDVSCKMLSHILQVYRPTLWYFGHWHMHFTRYVSGCRFVALNHSQGESPWYTELLDK